MRPQIYINELNIIREKYPHFIENMNHICQEGFNRTHDMIQSMKNPIVCYILVNHQVVGVSFGDIKYANIMKPMKNKIMYIHTISVDKDFQGNGFSTLMVKKLVKTYSKDHAMYMHVRVDDSNPNLAAIKSYEKCGFVLINADYVDRDDGPNCVMVLHKQIKQNIVNKKQKKHKKHKKLTYRK